MSSAREAGCRPRARLALSWKLYYTVVGIIRLHARCLIEVRSPGRIIALGFEAALKDLQGELIANPLAGGLDPGPGGLRKIRMPDPGRQQGKRGGVRVHYIFLPAHQVVYLVFVYGKDEQSTLDPRQKRQLKAVVEGIKAEWREPRGHRKRGP